jgi:hypothetical protein
MILLSKGTSSNRTDKAGSSYLNYDHEGEGLANVMIFTSKTFTNSLPDLFALGSFATNISLTVTLRSAF